MGFSNGIITLNSQNSAYYAGQVISGNVSFTLEQPVHLSVITVTFTGEAEVQWQETNGEECSGREQYFSYTQPLCGGNGFVTLPPGGHQFSFQYQIPFEVPSTFGDDKATIRYYVQVIANTPSGSLGTLEEYFTVIAPLDLNSSDEYKQPIELEVEQDGGGCCFGARPARVKLRAPVCGYCPGQEIPVMVSVDNGSDVEVRRLLFEIVSRTCYRSQSPQSELVAPPQVLVRVKRGPVLRKTAGDFVVRVPVPDMIAPNLDVGELIGIEYGLRVTVKMTGCSKDETDEATIFIGHIPVAGTQDYYEHPLKDDLPSGPIPVKPLQPTIPQQSPAQNMAYNAPNQAHLAQPTYPGVPPYTPPQNMGYPAPYPGANNTPYPSHPPVYNPAPYPQQNAGQNAPYYNAPAPQINWQWNGSSNPQVGYANNPSAPTAPSL